MNNIGIIPARMGSSRFPGKPLALIRGRAMIEHVYRRSVMSSALEAVYIATCDTVIEDHCRARGMNVVMTKDTHERASDRTAEAMIKIEHLTGKKTDIVVMIQGDEPMITPQMIDEAIAPFAADPGVKVVNLTAPLKSREEQADPHEIKVVVDKNDFALYFSREPIPSWKKAPGQVPMLKQVCVIPFRRDFLIEFNNLPPTPLEIAESVDMLRVLEHGGRVKMVRTRFDTYSVDTPADLEKVDRLMAEDPLVKKYA